MDASAARHSGRPPVGTRISPWMIGGIVLVIASAGIFALSKIGATRNAAPEKSDTENARLVRVDLSGQRLPETRLPSADLAGAELSGARLVAADMRSATLSDAVLVKTVLRDANLRSARLSGADLTGADLRGACLRDTRLRAADLTDARLGGADVRGGDLRQAVIERTDFLGAVYDSRTRWTRGRVPAGAVLQSRNDRGAC